MLARKQAHTMLLPKPSRLRHDGHTCKLLNSTGSCRV